MAWARQHALALVLVILLVFNAGPWLAPVFMHLGLPAGGQALYSFYGFFCHQMANRSFFLFGPRLMYAASDLPLELSGASGPDTVRLRAFRGNEVLGWKVAWSDRMVSMYGGLWLALAWFAWAVRRRRVRPLSLWLLALSVLPLLLDGSTHFLSDLSGLSGGFRYGNGWLATLTGRTLPDSFYRGDQLGSFNSWMRLASGLLFGYGVVWFALPYLITPARHDMASLDDLRAALRRWQDSTTEFNIKE